MACCKLPDNVQKKLDGVKKELKLKKLSRVMRVAAELSWNGWDENAVVGKLYREFDSVEKQGHKTKWRLEGIAESLTQELKGLNYNFPPREEFCSLHMWFAGEVSARQATQQCPQWNNRTGDEPFTPAKTHPSSSRVTCSQPQDKVNLTAQRVARRKVFRQTADSLCNQELVPLVQRILDDLSDEDTPDDVVISRVEAHLLVVSLLALYSSNSTDSNGANKDVAKISSQIGSHNSSASSSLSKRMRSSEQMVEDTATETSVAASESTTPTALPVKTSIIPVSWRVNPGEPVVHYDAQDAEVTDNFLAFLTSTYIDWSVISHIFSDLVIHALQLRASRLTAFYYENCAHVSERMKNIEPMPWSKDHTLQEDRAMLSDILAKFEPSSQNLMDVFHRNITLSEKLPLFPEQVPFMTCTPIIVQWHVPVSLSPTTRKQCRDMWNYFQSCMDAWRTQVQQAPDSLETLQLLERIPEIIKDKSPIVLKHPQVWNWLDGVHRLAEAICSRNSRKAEVEITVKQLRDYDRRSREALEEIKSKLAEFWRCNHQVEILRARSEARLNAMILKNQCWSKRHDSLLKDVPYLNVVTAQRESDMVEEYTFGVKKCLLPWSFPDVISLLEPIVVNLAWFVRQGYGNENLEKFLKQ